MILKILFWIFLGIIVYTYLVYTLLLLAISSVKKMIQKKRPVIPEFEPEVTLFIPAYNEKAYIEKKIQNSFQLSYPENKLKHLWITDGSDDGSPELLKKYANIKVLHQVKRNGKIEAMNRGMKEVTSPIVIFSDANTDLSKNAVREIVTIFSDEKVGCVAGEKKIYTDSKDKAVVAGEGFYWKYESLIKRLESEIGSTLGAAGELFAIRSSLYEAIEKDTILDDFTISLKIARKGYKIKYSSESSASEKASFSIYEELKRKIRIASGGFQTLFRMPGLLNIFRYGFLSFQYLSHKVLRWTLVPFSFIALLLTNVGIVLNNKGTPGIYALFLLIQLLFYLLVLAGYLIRNMKTNLKQLFLPYYIFIMNYSVFIGMIRYFRGKHTSLWEKAKRQ